MLCFNLVLKHFKLLVMYIISCKYIICELFEMDDVFIGYVIVFLKMPLEDTLSELN